MDQPSHPAGESRLAPAVDLIRALSWPWLVATLAGLLGAVLSLELATGLAVTVAQLFLVPVAVATFSRGVRAGLVTAAVATALGFAADAQRMPSGLLALVPLWNWTIRGLSFAAFAALLASLGDRIAWESALARTDAVTGAVNRLGFRELLGQELARARRGHQPLSLACIDLDKFKAVNDSHGHAEGDRVLKAVVAVSRSALRQRDVVFRLGGDEFAWLLPEADGPHAQAAALRALAAWRQQAEREGWQVRLSVGLATLHPSSLSFDALLKAADGAMYAAKKSGGDRIEAVEVGGGDLAAS